MTAAPSKPEKRDFSHPDEARSYPGLRIEFLRIAGGVVSRSVHQPGWCWSESIWPLVRRQGCPINHVFYVKSGRMSVIMNDGAEVEFGPGDVGYVPAGHDARVLGTEPCEIIDFGGEMEKYPAGQDRQRFRAVPDVSVRSRPL
jgi:uncharacterized protein YjlB